MARLPVSPVPRSVMVVLACVLAFSTLALAGLLRVWGALAAPFVGLS